MTIGERVAKQFQEDGHAYYDELVDMIDAYVMAQQDELRAAAQAIVDWDEPYIYVNSVAMNNLRDALHKK